MKRYELILNLALGAVVLVLAYLLATIGMARQNMLEASGERLALVESLSEVETQFDPTREGGVAPPPEVPEDRFEEFGQSDMFQAIIAKPTPPPTPTPTPYVPPPWEQIVGNWRLQGIIGDKALIQDQGSGESFTMEVGGEAHMAYHGPSATAFMVTLTGVDKMRREVNLISDRHKDPYTLKMFPDMVAP